MALTPEEIAASQYFDEDAYVNAKARIMVLNGKQNSLEAAKAQFLSKWTGDLIDHYLQYGAAENVNPSNSFDNSDYIQQVADAEGVTYQELKADWESQGITPLQHFLDEGEGLGYTAPPVSEDEQVPGGDVEPPAPVEGDTFTLTAGNDRGEDFTGTAGDDFFDAPLSQNPWAGGISNSLSSADQLDGGAGDDTLNAVLVAEFRGASGLTLLDIQPEIANIETIQLEAKDGMNDLIDDFVPMMATTFDAKDVTDVGRIGSYYSDGDLVIENLTTKTSDGGVRNTDAITITMDHTDNFNSDGDASDLKVLFDDNYLLSGEESEFTLELRIVNAFQLAENDDPLVGFLAVTFTAGTEEVTVDISSAETYADVVTLINAELTSLGLDVTAQALPERTAIFTDDIGPYEQGDLAGQYTPVQLVSNSLELAAGPIELDSNVEDFDGLNTWTNPTSETDDLPVAVNVELHKVGRGDDGGDLIIGAKSGWIYDGRSNGSGDDDDDGSDAGIPVIYVDVLGDDSKPSNLGQILSTGGALEEIYISTHEDFVDGDNFASLTVRGNSWGDAGAPFGGTLSILDADDFLGDLTIGSDWHAHNIDTFTATGGGDVTLREHIFYDDGDFPSLNDNEFTVDTGSGNDTVELRVEDGAQVIVHTGTGNDTIEVDIYGADDSGSTLTFADINSSGGNNTVEVDSNDSLHSANITLGGGADTVIGNDVNITVDTGAGNDVIYAENTGSPKTAGGYEAGDWIDDNGPTVDIDGNDVSVDQLLHGREVQVTVAIPFDGVNNGVAAFVNGFEATATIEASSGVLTTERDLYEAAARAINEDPVLNKLISVKVDSNGNLTGTYLIDGQANNSELITEMTVLGEWDDLSTSQQTDIVNALQVEYNDSTITETSVETEYDNLENVTLNEQPGYNTILGNDSNTDGSNVINAGLGDDVVVLSSADADQDLLNDGADARFDTVVFDAGLFGNDTIVHFEEGVGGDGATDGDLLDFTDWLDNLESASGSTISQVRILTDFSTSTADDFQANSVRVVDYTAIGDEGDIDDWSDLAGASASELLAWVEDAFDSTIEGADFVGSTQNSILIVQNVDGVDDNQGEYAVFQVVSDADSDDVDSIDSVQLIGTLDFGETQAFNDFNFA